MRRGRRGARDDRGRARRRAQGDARVPRRRDERGDRGRGAPRACGGVGRSRRQSADHRRPVPRRRRESGSVRVFGPAWPRRDPSVTTTYRVEVAIFAIALVVFGLVALALVWSGDWAYVGLAQATGNTRTTFVRTAGGRDPAGEIPMPLESLRDW